MLSCFKANCLKKELLRRIWLTIFSALLALHLLGQKIAVEEHMNYSFSPNSWSFFQSASNSSSDSDLFNLYQVGKFQPVQSSVYNGGIAEKAHWFEFRLSNSSNTPKDLIIDIQSPRLNELELFEVNNDSLYSLGRLGDKQLFNQRKIKHKDFVYEVKVRAQEEKQYFLFVNQIGHTFVLPIKISTPEIFQTSTLKNYVRHGLVYGVLLFVSVLSLLFYCSNRRRIYLYYSLYILTAIFWLLGYFGLGYEFLWSNSPFYNVVSAPLMADLNLFLNLQICQVLLRVKKTSPRLNRIINYSKASLLITGFFPLFINLNDFGYDLNHTYLTVFLILILVSVCIVCVAVFLYAFKMRSQEAKVYIPTSLFKVVSIINIALLEFGITPASYYLEELMEAGILIEITLLTYVIAKRYSLFQLNAFKLVLKGVENERDSISKRIHDDVSNPLTALKYSVLNLISHDEGLDIKEPAVGDNKLKKLLNVLEGVQSRSRFIAHSMAKQHIDQHSVENLLIEYKENIQDALDESKSIIKIIVRVSEEANMLEGLEKSSIYTIAKELITNIIKHSQATNAKIQLDSNKKEVILIVEDNGVGFDSKNLGAGIGLQSIRSMVGFLNGTMIIKSPYKIFDTEKNEETGSFITIKLPKKFTPSGNSLPDQGLTDLSAEPNTLTTNVLSNEY